MSGAEKAFELQRQVRRNATDYANSVKDLYSWEQDIKKKEKELKNAPATAANIVSSKFPLPRAHQESFVLETSGAQPCGEDGQGGEREPKQLGGQYTD